MSSPPPPSRPPLPKDPSLYYQRAQLQQVDGTPVVIRTVERFPRNRIPVYQVSKIGDYYILHGTGRKPGQPFRPPPTLASIQQRLVVNHPTNAPFWERQALRNVEKDNTNTGSSPKKLTIWEKHAARKQAEAMEKALKEKESRVVHSNYPPPPRLSLIPAFRAYQNNAAEKRKAGESGQQQKPFDLSSFEWMITFAMYEFVIGAVGGIVMGVEAGTIVKYKTPPSTPNTITPVAVATTTPVPIAPGNIRYGMTAFRVLRRGIFAGLLFGILEQQLKASRNKADWKNSAYSGFICGSIFGLRGGPRGIITGALGFTGYASIAALTKHILPPLK